MLHFHSSSLLSGLLLGALCLGANVTIAGAQPVPKDRVKVKAPAPELGQIPVVFSVSTSGDASALGSSGDYLPSGADVDPQTKGYYIEVKASVTLPATVNASVLPNTIQIQARRILYQTTPAGLRTKVYTGDTVDFITLQQANSAPNAAGTERIYFYERYPPPPYSTNEELEIARVENDWNVSKVMGRWEVRVHPDDGPSNLVEVKINKRAQITNTAINWSDYVWNYHPEWHTKGPYWNLCQGFAAFVYQQHGLDGLPNTPGDGKAQLAAATAADGEPGSLRFFWSSASPPGDPGHIAIIGPPTYYTGSGTRIDNNGSAPRNVTLPNGNELLYNGPTFNSLDHGVGATGGYQGFGAGVFAPVDQTLPSKRTPGQSLLQELDGE